MASLDSAPSRTPTTALAPLSLLTLAGAQAVIRLQPSEWVATPIFLLAAVVLAVVLRDGRSIASTSPLEIEFSGSSWRLAGAMLTAAVLAYAVGAYRLTLSWEPNFYLGWTLFLGATVVASLALRLISPRNPTALPWTRSEALAFLAILAMGTWLRFHDITVFPDGYTTHAIEEQQTGLGAFRILTTRAHPWEFFLDYHVTAFFLWLDSTPNFTTIRIPYILASALTIIPTHLLFRQLLRPSAALAGTFLSAALSWNLLYSRCAHPIFMTNVLVVTVYALLVHIGRTRRLAGAPWVGFLSATTLYSYAGYRGTSLFVLIFLAGLLAAALWQRARGTQPARLGATVAVTAVVLVTLAGTAAPLRPLLLHAPSNYYFEAADRALANRSYYTEDRQAFLTQRFERIADVARIFMHVGDDSPTFNYPGTPMLDPVTASLATVGLFLLVLQWRRGYNAYFLFIAFTLLSVGTVFVQNLDVRRLQGLTIFVVYAAAYAVDHLAAWARQRRQTARSLMTCVAAVAGMGVLLWSYDLYFVRMASDPGVRRAFKDYYTTMIRFGQEEARGRSVLLSSIMHRFFDPGYHYRYNYSWLLDQSIHGKSLPDLVLLRDPTKIPTVESPRSVVIQEPFEGKAAADFLSAVYPGIECRPFLEPDNPWIALTVCDLPDELLPRSIEWRLRARYWQGPAAKGPPTLERDEPFLGYSIVPDICFTPIPNASCAAEWRGSFDVPQDGPYFLLIESIGRTTFEVRVDGRKLDPKVPQALTAGEHALEAQATLPRDWETGLRLSLTKDGGVPRVVPFYRGLAADQPASAK